MKIDHVGWLVVAVASAGCNKPEEHPSPTPHPEFRAITVPTASSGKNSLSLLSTPQALQNDAYHYYGLSSLTEKHYQVKYSAGGVGGSQLVTLIPTKVGQDRVTFDENDKGTAATTQSMSLEQSGIYVDSIKPQTLKTPHFLQLPGKLNVGATWTSHQSVFSNDQSLDETLNCKVVGDRKVSTLGGTFTALYIVGSGIGKLNSTSTEMKVESWYVKDVGLVKQIATITGPGIKSTIEETLTKQPEVVE